MRTSNADKIFLDILNTVSDGVVSTPIHAEGQRDKKKRGEGGGGSKMSYPSNFSFKHPMKLKLGMNDHHNN